MLHIDLLGRVRAYSGAKRVPIPLTRQCATALAYLAATRGQFHSRDHLIECFWPDAGGPRGRANLSSAMWRLRRTLEPEAILLVHPLGDIGIDRAAPVHLDSELFEKNLAPAFATKEGALSAAALRTLLQALELYRGEYMPGWYDEWVLAERERLHALHVRAQMRLLEHYSAAADIEAALCCAYELLKMDPLRESVHRRLMRLYAQSGEPAKIVAQYQSLIRTLKAELGVRPSVQTEALYRDLMASPDNREAV
jgi:DNA-binding SARP family transcriptional activator